MNRHVLAPVDTALDLVAQERSEVVAERDAFAAFAARVDACPVQPPPPEAASPPNTNVRTTGTRTDASSGAGPHDRLRRAYRETVMAVDHYDAVYDEPLPVNVATEFDVDLATALCRGVPFTPAFKSTLHDAATTAQSEREWFAEVLQREQESLAEARSDLDDVLTELDRHHDEAGASRDAAADGARSLAELERRCERVGDDRQAVVQTQLQASHLDDALYDYLYGDQSWTYPVLSTVATLVDDLSVMRGVSSGL